MILPSPLDRALTDGRKTQHRIPIKPGRLTSTITPCPYTQGSTRAVQRRAGGPQIARIEILLVERSTLKDLTYKDARAEGHQTTAGFADHWMRQHDTGWPPAQPCPDCDHQRSTHQWDPNVDHCQTCDNTGGVTQDTTDLNDQTILERFTQRHHTTPVWVLHLRLTQAPRLLAASGSAGIRYRKLATGRVQAVDVHEGRDADRGYTTSPYAALPGESEAIDQTTLDQYVKDAHARGPVQRSYLDQQLLNEADGLQDRLRRLQDIARKRGVDVRADVRVIEARLTQIEIALAASAA